MQHKDCYDVREEFYNVLNAAGQAVVVAIVETAAVDGTIVVVGIITFAGTFAVVGTVIVVGTVSVVSLIAVATVVESDISNGLSYKS